MEKTMAISYNTPSVSDLWRKVRRATLVRMRAIRMRGGFTAYYTPETRRSRRYEDRPRDSRRYVHFEFRDISEMP